MTPVLDNAVDTINAYVADFMVRHEDKLFAIPMGDHKGEMLPITKCNYRINNPNGISANDKRYGKHGLMVTLKGSVGKGSKIQQFSMTYHAMDIEGLLL
jgi:hypothetical protein